MPRRLVVLSFLLGVGSGLGCPATISGGSPAPLPESGGQDPDPAAEHCFNGLDDDGDSAIDCWDLECRSFASCGGGLAEDAADAGPAPGPEPGTEPPETEIDEGVADPAEDVTAGQSVDASIDPVGDDDWYRIWLAGGDRLIVETSDGAGSCEVDTIVQIFGAIRPDPLPVSASCEDETGDVMCDDDGGEGMCSWLDHLATADGFAHVRVLAYGGDDTGDYRVTFTVIPASGPDEPGADDLPGHATAIADGDVVEGEVDPATDEDYFTLEVRAFETVRLETSDGQGGCNFDSVLTLYDALEEPSEGTSCLDDLEAFACDDDEGTDTCSLLEHVFWQDGAVLARVISYGHLSTGAYSMSVSIR